MRVLSRVLSALLLLAGIAVLLTGTTLAQSGDSLIRFVHALPAAGAVDIYIDNTPAVRNLGFGEGSTFLSVAAGSHTIVTTLADATTPLWSQDFAPGVGQAYTLVVSSTEPLAYTAYQDDINPLAVGRARITAIHAIADAPAVDVVLADGRAVVPGLSYNQPYGTLDIPALTYELAVVPAGGAVTDAVIPVTTFPLNAGTSYVVIAYGTLSNPQALLLGTPTTAEGEAGYVRLVHGVAGAPAVDIYANDTLIAPSLAFGADTGFIALPPGTYAASIRAAGDTEEIASASLTVEANLYITAVALADGDNIAVEAFETGVESADQLSASLSIINGVLGQDVTVSLEDGEGTSLLDAVAAGDANFATAAPNTAGLNAIINLDGTQGSNTLPASVVYGGVAYTIVAVAGESGIDILPLTPVSIAQTIGSAPGETLLAAAPAQVAVEPTATSLPPGEPTAAPPAEPQVVAAQPTAVPAAAADVGPTARVVLDPGANLQLRQYPNRDALSLGLAPSGTILIVNGRVGFPELPPGVPTPTLAPEATEAVDPATLLAPEEDFVPADTWLNIDYITPDGGVITAWVNAQFLDVRDGRGRRQRLADLPTIPANRPGEARDTAVTSPPLPENIVIATVGGLDPNVNLQIRRTPSTTGESLALVPNDTALELIGINEAREWAFIRYVQPEGGEVRGWVSLSFLRSFTFRNIPTDLETLEEQGRLSFTPDTERGALQAGAAGPAAPTRDPLRNVVVATIVLNQDANLHLRRSPNANSESLVLMPNGTQLVVTGRSDTSEWVQVEFEGQIGWTSTQYLTFTFNGTPYNLVDAPVTFNLTITPFPTATPGA